MKEIIEKLENQNNKLVAENRTIKEELQKFNSLVDKILPYEIAEQLKNKGFNIACIKISNKEIHIDSPKKDSWKYAKAGSDLIVLSSINETDFLIKQKN